MPSKQERELFEDRRSGFGKVLIAGGVIGLAAFGGYLASRMGGQSESYPVGENRPPVVREVVSGSAPVSRAEPKTADVGVEKPEEDESDPDKVLGRYVEDVEEYLNEKEKNLKEQTPIEELCVWRVEKNKATGKYIVKASAKTIEGNTHPFVFSFYFKEENGRLVPIEEDYATNRVASRMISTHLDGNVRGFSVSDKMDNALGPGEYEIKGRIGNVIFAVKKDRTYTVMETPAGYMCTGRPIGGPGAYEECLREWEANGRPEFKLMGMYCP